MAYFLIGLLWSIYECLGCSGWLLLGILFFEWGERGSFIIGWAMEIWLGFSGVQRAGVFWVFMGEILSLRASSVGCGDVVWGVVFVVEGGGVLVNVICTLDVKFF